MVFCFCSWSCNIFLLFTFIKDGGARMEDLVFFIAPKRICNYKYLPVCISFKFSLSCELQNSGLWVSHPPLYLHFLGLYLAGRRYIINICWMSNLINRISPKMTLTFQTFVFELKTFLFNIFHFFRDFLELILWYFMWFNFSLLNSFIPQLFIENLL